MKQPIFEIKACCLICARGEPEDGVVLCSYTKEAYREGWYCGLFMLRDLGQNDAAMTKCQSDR